MNEEQKIAELLKPRYEVIADYPGSKYLIGDIIEMVIGRKEIWDNNRNGMRLNIEPQTYPAIFKPLQWWERREDGELEVVKYVRSLSSNSVRTVKEFQLHWDKIVLGGGKIRPVKQWLPATLSDYNNFLNQQNSKQ